MPNHTHRPPGTPDNITVTTGGFGPFGRHRFRAPVGIVIDTPFPSIGGWVAEIWLDASRPGGWQRLLWEADTSTGRRWLIPERLAFADVVEFGSDPTGAQRWYGIVESYEPRV